MSALTRHPVFHDQNYPSEVHQSSDQKKMVVDFNAKVKNKEIGFERAHCLCGSIDFDLVSTYDRYRVWQPIGLCRSCGLMRCDPRFTRETLDWFYGSDFYCELHTAGGDFKPPEKAEYDRLAAQSRVYKNVEDIIDLTTVKRVGEFGCGSGCNLYPFFQQGMDILGVDLGAALVKAGQRVGMDLRQGSIEDMNGAPFDLLILSHVLEHLPDPIGDMRRLLQHLKPDGHVYIGA